METGRQLTATEKHVSMKETSLPMNDWTRSPLEVIGVMMIGLLSSGSLIQHVVWCRCVSTAVPRAGPRNMRVFDATTSTLTIGWDHAEGPVRQYRIAYAPLTGDPITEYVSTLLPAYRMYVEA